MRRITTFRVKSVRPQYLDGQSKPEEGHYVWAYTITIENHGRETVTLRTRYWKITDANGHKQEVRGAGVVGEQPELKPGDSFSYTSGCPLKTPSGFMVGAYQMLGRRRIHQRRHPRLLARQPPRAKHAIN
jgi:ApaG protein